MDDSGFLVTVEISVPVYVRHGGFRWATPEGVRTVPATPVLSSSVLPTGLFAAGCSDANTHRSSTDFSVLCSPDSALLVSIKVFGRYSVVYLHYGLSRPVCQVPVFRMYPISREMPCRLVVPAAAPSRVHPGGL
jgi:hypothetical protein